jgi:transcriptional regulator with XRE-family HTH domain
MRLPKNANPGPTMPPRAKQSASSSPAPADKKTPAPDTRRSTASKGGTPAQASDTSKTRATRNAGTEKEASLVALGERLRAIRNGLGLTLADAARITGAGASTLSKIETGQMSPTYDVLQKIVRGLKIDIVDLFDERQHQRPAGRRDITRAGTGRPLKTPRYQHELLATELSHKQFMPFRSRITARVPMLGALDTADNESSHAGEEFFYVLSGAVELHTDSYAPVRLDTGDSVYFDSRMRHAVISVSKEDAVVLWVASHA